MSFFRSVISVVSGAKQAIPDNNNQLTRKSHGPVNNQPNKDSNSIYSSVGLAFGSFALAPLRCAARQSGNLSETLKVRREKRFFGVIHDYRTSAGPLALMVFGEQAIARNSQERLQEAGYSNTSATILGTLSGAVVGGSICPFTVSNRRGELTIRRYIPEALGSTIRNSGSIAGFLANPYNSQDDPGKRSLFTGVVFAGTRAFDASWQQMLDGGKPCRGRIIKCMGMSGIYAAGVTTLSDKILNSKIFQR